MDNFLIAEKVRKLAENLVSENGLELVHVEVIGSKKKPTVRILIDHEDGITHDHCSEVSVAVDDFLEDEDFISSSYVLEVSSPGIERGLYSAKDFEKFAGSLAKVKTRSAIGGQKIFRGRVLSVEGEEVFFEDVSNGSVRFKFSEVWKANLEVDLAKELSQKSIDRKSKVKE